MVFLCLFISVVGKFILFLNFNSNVILFFMCSDEASEKVNKQFEESVERNIQVIYSDKRIIPADTPYILKRAGSDQHVKISSENSEMQLKALKYIDSFKNKDDFVKGINLGSEY